MSYVLQLVSRDEPGGVQVLAAMIGEGLTQRGHRVTTLALADGLGAVARAALRERYDAIFSYQVAAGLAGSLLGWIGGVEHRVAHLTALPHAMRPHWRWLDRVYGSVGLHSAIIANSAATAESIERYPKRYRDRLRCIPHGVVPLPEPAAIDWRGRLGLPPGTRLLVASGRLSAQKNHALAVAALAHIPEAHLVIAGEGELRAALLEQAARLEVGSRLHLPGTLPRAALVALLRQSAVMLFPSKWESFGLAAVEAAMLGLPTVAADLPVLREVLAPVAPELAWFHPPDDGMGLAIAVRDCLGAYPASPVRQASAAKTVAAHSVDTMIEAYCRLLASP